MLKPAWRPWAVVLAPLVAIAVARAGPPERPAQPAPMLWTPSAFSTAEYEAAPAFSPDGQWLYFMRADPAFRRYRLLVSRCGTDGWSDPVPVPFAAAPPVDDADPFVTPDGTRLYFVSTRHRGASAADADFDIYYVERTPAGGWGPAIRLPEPVNSGASELLPRTDASGRLYFGSSRPGGFGQSDIYVATPAPGGRWTVANVGAPVSTPANEYEADVSADGRTLVVVADRGVRSHLYRYVKRDSQWVELGRVPSSDAVFQVGPRLSPSGDRLLYSQATERLSGEIFLIDLSTRASPAWPPSCGRR